MSAVHTIIELLLALSLLLLFLRALLQSTGIPLGPQAASPHKLGTSTSAGFSRAFTTCKDLPSDFSCCLYLCSTTFLFHIFPVHLEKELLTSAKDRGGYTTSVGPPDAVKLVSSLPLSYPNLWQLTSPIRIFFPN